MLRSAKRLPTRASLIDFNSPEIEFIRSLRLALSLRRDDSATFDIVVTSSEPGTGKSTIAANIALVSAAGGDRTLLIDADVAKPVQHAIFGVSRSPGLVECLAGTEELARLVQPGPASLGILTSGREISRVTDALTSGRMTKLLALAREHYDTIVIDTPPILASTDAAAIASQSSVEVLFVVSPDTRRRDLSRGIKRLEFLDAPIAGIVLNREGEYNLYAYGS
jgi:capsular exopolysaccharide synthesis family protein